MITPNCDRLLGVPPEEYVKLIGVVQKISREERPDMTYHAPDIQEWVLSYEQTAAIMAVVRALRKNNRPKEAWKREWFRREIGYLNGRMRWDGEASVKDFAFCGLPAEELRNGVALILGE